jgi:hypothetical protein
MQTDDADQSGNSAPFSDEPSEPDPGLRWWKGWARGSPRLEQVLAPPPNVELPGEVEEVRIRRTSREGAYMLQIGFRPSGTKRDG